VDVSVQGEYGTTVQVSSFGNHAIIIVSDGARYCCKSNQIDGEDPAESRLMPSCHPLSAHCTLASVLRESEYQLPALRGSTVHIHLNISVSCLRREGASMKRYDV
jgi:hypothetical protein